MKATGRSEIVMPLNKLDKRVSTIICSTDKTKDMEKRPSLVPDNGNIFSSPKRTRLNLLLIILNIALIGKPFIGGYKLHFGFF